MKNLIKLLFVGIVLCPLIGTAVSCSEEEDCSMNARMMLNCTFYSFNPETQVVKKDTIDSLTITAYGTDSIILNNQKSVVNLSLPLRYSTNTTQLVFRYSRNKADTVTIGHNNVPYFLSIDCGYQMQQTVTEVQHTNHQLDSIYVSSNEANLFNRENLKLFSVWKKKR